MIKTIRKRMLAMLMTLAMVVSIMPAMTLSAKAADPTLLQTVDFETAGAGYSVTGAPTFTDDDWWARVKYDHVNIGDPSFTNQQGDYYFYGEDTDSGRTTDDPVYVTLNSVTVTGYSNLQLNILVAGNNNVDAGKEKTEYLKIQYSIDGGAFTDRTQFIAPSVNATYYAEDTNCDGTTEGASLSPAFTEFTYSIPVTGTSLQIRIAANINSGREEVGFDNIRIYGTEAPAATPPSITTQPSDATVDAGGNTSFTVAATGTALTYQWQVHTGDAFSDIANGGIYSNATTATLNITGATAGMNNYRYRAVVSGSAGSAVTSTAATLTVNSAPTDIELSPSSVNENVAGNTTVGTLSSTDPNAGNTFTYSLVAGDGSTDNAAFNISDSSLRITNSPNYESKSSYSVRVRTTDQGGLTYDKAFTITINDVNDAPSITSGATANFAENGISTVYIATGTDVDANTITWSISGTDAGLFDINGSTGFLTFKAAPNFEAPTDSGANNVYDITLTATDNGDGALSASKALAITVTNVNEAPTDIALSASSVNENVAGNTEVGTLSSTDPDASNTFTYTLVAGDGDADNGSFNIIASSLRITNSPNNETKSSYTVRVRTTDQGGLWYEESFTITINNVNETPTDIELSDNSVNENVAGNTEVGTLSSTDPDAGNTFTYTLVAGGGDTDNGSFNISGSSLRITNSPNYEAKSSYSLRVRTTDQGGLWYEEAFTITINNFNEAPTDISLSASSVNENVAVNTMVGTLSSTDPDAGNTFTYALVSVDGDTSSTAFNLSGSDLRITNSPDRETKSSYIVRVRSTDQGGLTFEKDLTITISNVNEVPTDIALSSTSVSESAGIGTTIGTLSTTDPDSGDSFTYTLVAGTGSDDNGSFSIDENALKTNVAFVYATKNSYTIRVRATDAGGLTFEKAFVISITETNQAPTDMTLSATSIDENLVADSTVGTLSATDANTWDTFTYTLVAGDGSGDNASFNILGSALRLTGSANYETKSSYLVRIRATDIGGLWFEEAYIITINNVNEAPTDIALTASAVNENAAGNTTVGTLSTTDSDAGNTFTYTLVSVDGDTGSTAFNISGSSLRITNSPDYETKSSYAVRVRTTDQGGLWYEETFTITVNNLNETPIDMVLTASAVNENVAGNTTVGTFSSTDPDAGNAFTYTLVVGDGDTDNAAFNISGSSLRITSSPDYETKSSYTVRVRTTDQASLLYEEAFTITISNVNETPTDLSLSANSVDENVAGNTTVGTLSSTDPDAGNTFTYSLVAGAGDTDNAAFSLSGGSLRLTNSPDYETKSSYSVRVRTTDQGGLWHEEALTITINNVNETPTDISLSANSVDENVAGNTTVGTLSSTDADEGSTFTYTLVAGTGDTDNATFNMSGSSLRITNSPDCEAKSSYSVRIRTTDQTNLWYEEAFTITINDVNEAPVITTNAAISVTEGSTAAFTAAGSDPEGSAISWSITGGADAAKFNIVAGTGVVTFVTAPSFSAPSDADTNNSYILEIRVSDGTLTVAKTVTITVTQQVSSGGGGGTTTGSTVVEVNGQKQDAGTTATTTTGGQTTTTIKVDDTKLNTILENSGAKPTVTLPTNTNSDVVVGELNGQTIKNMEAKEAVLEIKTGTVSYTLPASQINIDSVSAQLGTQVELKDIKVSVKIAEPPADTVKVVQDTANKNSYQIVVKPVEFEITCTSGDKSVEVSKFNGYVERTVAIPDGVDPSKITTGIVLNSDGTFCHVPTSIVVINGKYYAKINSLTNSTYLVIYNPVSFADVENHWAKIAINDMGSRLVVTGIGNSTYEPDRSITRAEFAAIVVRAMGLQKGTTESSFGDVTLTDWFNGYVDTATAYFLITGYDSASYGPNDTITREQAMAIIARAMKLTGLSVSLTDIEISALLAKYTDGASVSDYAKTSAAMCLKTGVVSGSSATALSPKAYVTRAEVAVMVQRLLQKSGLI